MRFTTLAQYIVVPGKRVLAECCSSKTEQNSISAYELNTKKKKNRLTTFDVKSEPTALADT
jgi:hypothetical protein